MPHLISICIPAYKRTDFLKRLLGSIDIQNFRDFEVIVTDDSPDDAVQLLCEQYAGKFELHHHRNPQALGTPENWNEGIRRATGQWIKLVHDDDWFSDEGSLARYVEAINKNPSASFIFSAYSNVYLDKNETKHVFVHAFRYWLLRKNPVTLFSQNIIGPPSVVLHRNDGRFFYDNRLKWVVDIEFYIRCFAAMQFYYLPRVSINVGIGKEQVTQDCFLQRPVEIPENFYLLNKAGVINLENIFVYDAWWRLMRNLEIKNRDDIPASGYSGEIPAVILSMISRQAKLPSWILKTGIFSKCAMFVHYLFNYHNIKR